MRKVERVERESLMRVREAVSLAILKCEVHWAMRAAGSSSRSMVGLAGLGGGSFFFFCLGWFCRVELGVCFVWIERVSRWCVLYAA